jgi:hypothetical protein
MKRCMSTSNGKSTAHFFKPCFRTFRIIGIVIELDFRNFEKK